MSHTISPEVLDQTERAVTMQGEPPSAIHRRIGMWSVTTVRFALSELARTGRITFDGADGSRRYRKPIRESSPALLRDGWPP